MAKNGHFGLKINVLGPEGADLGRLDALKSFQVWGGLVIIFMQF